MGRYWHHQGRLEAKLNSLHDCVACINHLIIQGDACVFLDVICPGGHLASVSSGIMCTQCN